MLIYIHSTNILLMLFLFTRVFFLHRGAFHEFIQCKGDIPRPHRDTLYLWNKLMSIHEGYFAADCIGLLVSVLCLLYWGYSLFREPGFTFLLYKLHRSQLNRENKKLNKNCKVNFSTFLRSARRKCRYLSTGMFLFWGPLMCLQSYEQMSGY